MPPYDIDYERHGREQAEDTPEVALERRLWLRACQGDLFGAQLALYDGARGTARFEPDWADALTVACRLGRDHVVALLAPKARDLNEASNFTHVSPFIAAAAGNHPECLKILLSAKNADPNAGYRNGGWTPLMAASAFGHIESIRALLASPLTLPQKVNLDSPEHLGQNALMVACANGRAGCVELLIQHIDPAAVDAKGRDALMLAAENDSPDCLLLLLNSSDPMRVDSAGRDALIHAARRGSLACCSLLAPISDTTRKDIQDMTAIDYARQQGREIERLLIAHAEAQAIASSIGTHTAGQRGARRAL